MNEFTTTRWTGLYSPQDGVRETWTWPELLSWLSIPILVNASRLKRDPKTQKLIKPNPLAGWAPGTFRHNHRKKENCETLWGLGLDYDDGTPHADARSTWPYQGLIHTTFNGGFRVVLVLSRPVNAAEYESVWLWAERRAKASNQTIDKSTKDASRFWFLPALPEGAAYVCEAIAGEPLDVDSVLAEWKGIADAEKKEKEAARARAKKEKRSETRGEKRSESYGSKALSSACAKIVSAPEGERNKTLNNEAFCIGGLIAACKLDEAEVERALVDAGVRAGLSEVEARATVRSGLDAGKKKPRTIADDDDGADGDGAPRLTELGNSERLIDRFGNDLRFCSALGGWMQWSDGSGTWSRDATGEVVRCAKMIAKSFWGDARDAKTPEMSAALGGWARTSEKARSIASMIKLAESDKRVATMANDFDRDPWLLNVQNGTLDLRTGELRPHDPANMCTKLAPVAFDANATCPRWTQFLTEVQPDPTVRTFLQRFAGYVATGVIRERVLVLLVGGGRNGKSVFVRAISHLLGDYATYAAPDILMAREGQRHPTELADLFGVRFAALSEAKADRSFDEETLKRLTGNEPIKARYIGKDFFEFEMTAKLAMAVNHRPRVADTTQSIWDRLREVPFTVRIDEANEDRALFEKLCAEMPGILNWTLEGCREWQREGLGAPAAVMAATAEYRESEDRLAAFFDECTVTGASERMSRFDLRSAYESWSRMQGEKPMDLKAFAQAVREKGFESSKVMGVRFWKGLRLRRDGEVGQGHEGHVGAAH